MENKNALIFVGNGFDLNHGLKTKYFDIVDYIDNNKLLKDNKFFDILKEKNTETWIDIEEEIFLFVQLFIKMSEKYLFCSEMMKIEFEYIDFLKYIMEDSNNININSTGTVTIYNIKPQYLVTTHNRKYLDYEKIKKSILQDIENIIYQVNNYLKIENEKFVKKDNDIIEKTLNVYSETAVINFNYNSNILDYIKASVNRNIHGTIDDNNIIIGHNDILDISFKNLNKKTLMNARFPRCFNTLILPGNGKQYFDIVIIGHSFDRNDFEIYISAFKRLNYYNKVAGQQIDGSLKYSLMKSKSEWSEKIDLVKIFYYDDNDKVSKAHNLLMFDKKYSTNLIDKLEWVEFEKVGENK